MLLSLIMKILVLTFLGSLFAVSFSTAKHHSIKAFRKHQKSVEIPVGMKFVKEALNGMSDDTYDKKLCFLHSRMH